MPFGLTEAPRKFTKLTKPPLALIRQSGYNIANFLDDFFQAEHSYDLCYEAIQCAYSVLVSIGFLPNFNKSVLVPTQCIDALGHTIDSRRMVVYLPPTKTHCIVDLCKSAIANPTFTIRLLCVLIGKLISCFLVLPFGKMHYRSLERLKVAALHNSHQEFNTLVTLTAECMEDLNWWCLNLPSACAPVYRGVASIVFTSDASDEGWSANFNSFQANGPFTLEEASYHINTKEILAVYYGLQSFANQFQNHHVLCMSDSTSAVGVLKKMGSMDNIIHDRLAREVWEFAKSINVWLSMTYLPGKLNSESDFGSRHFSDVTEWSVPQYVFNDMVNHFKGLGFPPVVLDLFASRLNYKVFPYYSWNPDPFCAHVDSFTVRWHSPYLLYAYCPFSVLPLLLQKITQDGPTVLTVFPLWSQQMWFNKLLSMLVSHIVLLPDPPGVFLPSDPSRTHPMLKNLRLCAAILSGNRDAQQKFLSKLPTSSRPQNLQALSSKHAVAFKNGGHFVWKGRLIEIVPLWRTS